jgi:hypothetical protein
MIEHVKIDRNTSSSEVSSSVDSFSNSILVWAGFVGLGFSQSSSRKSGALSHSLALDCTLSGTLKSLVRCTIPMEPQNFLLDSVWCKQTESSGNRGPSPVDLLSALRRNAAIRYPGARFFCLLYSKLTRLPTLNDLPPRHRLERSGLMLAGSGELVFFRFCFSVLTTVDAPNTRSSFF